MHYKYQSETIDEFFRHCFIPIETKLITGNGEGLSNEDRSIDPEKLSELIINAQDFEVDFESDLQQIALKLISSNIVLDLPDKFHFCSVIFEMMKQYNHCKKWYDAKRELKHEEQGFKFKRWKSSLHSDLELMAKQKIISDKEQIKSKRSFSLALIIEDGTLMIQENKIKKVFVDKSEIVEILNQRRLFRVKQKHFKKYWDLS
jgi:hypothetical protein